MAVELLELKFRLYDGTDIGPNKYALTTTIGSLKESILAQWPRDKDQNPRTINDLKLINGGKVLENSKTVAESRVPAGEIPGEAVTMHVVVRLSTSDTGTDQQQSDRPMQNKCACTIL